MNKFFLGSIVALLAIGMALAQSDPYLKNRQTMVETQIEARGISDKSVLSAMMRVKRHQFVPPRMVPLAYVDSPLPIEADQTISQPYIVALMTELLEVGPNDTVLEVGTGSGYQAAVLGEIVNHVYTIEIIDSLAQDAKKRLKILGYKNISVKTGDGYKGWPDKAPFDGIVVTAAPDHVPPPLIKQLKAGGRMVIPVGGESEVQELLLIEKSNDGTSTERAILPVRFVPLTGKH